MKKLKEWVDKNLEGDKVIWAVVFCAVADQHSCCLQLGGNIGIQTQHNSRMVFVEAYFNGSPRSRSDVACA